MQLAVHTVLLTEMLYTSSIFHDFNKFRTKHGKSVINRFQVPYFVKSTYMFDSEYILKKKNTLVPYIKIDCFDVHHLLFNNFTNLFLNILNHPVNVGCLWLVW